MMGMWRGTCEVKTLTQSHQMEILKKISKTRSVFQISSWRGAWSPLRKKIQCHEAFSNQQKISGRKSLDWMLLSNRFVRTAEGGVSTGGGMDMTKYLSGSYYRLYTLQVWEDSLGGGGQASSFQRLDKATSTQCVFGSDVTAVKIGRLGWLSMCWLLLVGTDVARSLL